MNPNYKIGDLHTNESFAIQKIMTDKYIEEKNISPVILNPYQIHPYYTIPHELLSIYKIKKQSKSIALCFTPWKPWNVSSIFTLKNGLSFADISMEIISCHDSNSR